MKYESHTLNYDPTSATVARVPNNLLSLSELRGYPASLGLARQGTSCGWMGALLRSKLPGRNVRAQASKDKRVSGSDDDSIQPPQASGLLARHLCRVTGVNRNLSSRSGTSYHVQVEDRGPVFDDASEEWVRRVSVIVYANYGEPSARIIHGQDHDLPDQRTHEHNEAVARRIQELAAEATRAIEEREDRQVSRLKSLLRGYHETRQETVRRELEETNTLYPFVFARAFQELKAERAPAEAGGETPAGPAAEDATAPAPPETVYPLDPAQREIVLDIERVARDMERNLAALEARGAGDDILRATCAKLLARARESLARHDGSEFAIRRMEMTRKSLVAAYQQVRARLNRAGGG
jgi:hypothetical protein